MREGVGQQTASELDQIKGVLRADSIQDRLMPYLKDAHALEQTSLQMTEAAAKGRAVRSCGIGERRVGPGAAYGVSGRRSISPN